MYRNRFVKYDFSDAEVEFVKVKSEGCIENERLSSCHSNFNIPKCETEHLDGFCGRCNEENIKKTIIQDDSFKDIVNDERNELEGIFT